METPWGSSVTHESAWDIVRALTHDSTWDVDMNADSHGHHHMV